MLRGYHTPRPTMSVNDLFEAIDMGIKADQSMIQKVGGVYKFVVDGSVWYVDLKNGQGGVSQSGGNADVTLTLGSDDFMKLMTGQMSGPQAFMQGKVKLKGNMALAMKLNTLVALLSAAQASTAGSSNAQGVTPEFIFEEIERNIQSDPSILQQIGTVYKFVIDNDTWIVDLKNRSGRVAKGDGEADTIITMKSQDFVDLMTGALNGQQAFMQGKLKIKGNMANAMKLSQLTQQRAKL